jgi:hypothetical protein
MHLRPPAQFPGLHGDPQHVGVLEGAHHERVARDRRARTRDVPRDPCVVRYRVRPDHLAGLGVELPEHATKVPKVHGPVHDSRRCGNIASGRCDPLQRQATGVLWPDPPLKRLMAGIPRIVADHRPVPSVPSLLVAILLAFGTCICRVPPRIALRE